MEKKNVELPPEAVKLYKRHVDGAISRREFLARVSGLAVVGLSAAAIVDALENKAMAQQVMWGEGLPNAWTGMDPTYPVGMREFPQNNPDIPEIWIYSDRMSYSQGDSVVFYVHTNAPKYDLLIERDGGEIEKVYEQTGIAGIAQETPDDAYTVGCGWKESHRLQIPGSWKSGLYVITVTAELPGKGTTTGEHFIVVKNARPGSSGKIALMLATSSYIAYNDWGGGNGYRSQGTDQIHTKLTTQRPWARGFAQLPANHPRHGGAPVLNRSRTRGFQTWNGR